MIVLGHAHFDGRAALNLPGPDIHADEFGKLFQGLQCREQVFIITTAASGFFVRHLSAQGRIVITATEADQEVNETLFLQPLADLLDSPPPKAEYDRDRDGRITVLDLYLTVVRHVMEAYRNQENIPTEHAQLDDNGDRRTTEVQMDYLPPELDGRARPGAVPRPIRPPHDGALAARVVVPTELIGTQTGDFVMVPIPALLPVPGLVPILVLVPVPALRPERST